METATGVGESGTGGAAEDVDRGAASAGEVARSDGDGGVDFGVDEETTSDGTVLSTVAVGATSPGVVIGAPAP